MAKGKAYIHTGQGGAVAVDFKNFSALERDVPTMTGETVLGLMFVYNATENLLKKAEQHVATRQKFIEGLGGEISHSILQGWNNVYVTTFEEVVNNDESYPDEFTLHEDDDTFIDARHLKEIRDVIMKHSAHLKKIKVVGVLDSEDFDDLRAHAHSISTEIEIDSKSAYLIQV